MVVRQQKLVSDILERELGLLELKCNTFVFSGEGFASGNLHHMHRKLKLIF
jgi:hypothetical protein